MKIKRLLSIIILSLLIIGPSCKKEEALDRSNTNISLAGKWELISIQQFDGEKYYWGKSNPANPPKFIEFTNDGRYIDPYYANLIAYKITSPGEVLLQDQTDGTWQPFRYSATKSGELIINPSSGRYACIDYGCVIKYKRAP
jgi:hypothetical protein